jgi:hypothetical protein
MTNDNAYGGKKNRFADMSHDELMVECQRLSIAHAASLTGIEAANAIAEYLRLRGLGDEGDAANIIHILQSNGVLFKRPDLTPHGLRRCPVDDQACDCIRPCSVSQANRGEP